QSGNVVLTSDRDPTAVQGALEAALAKHLGQPVPVVIRTAAALAEEHAANPFADAPGNHAYLMFFDRPLAPDVLDGLVAPGGERVARGPRVLYLHYPDGMGRSKLRVPGASAGTARNLNTVAKLVAMCAEATPVRG
ncbi:MAG: DUF1697 domain-containing protein, partial [Polyangiales bacterium]